MEKALLPEGEGLVISKFGLLITSNLRYSLYTFEKMAAGFFSDRTYGMLWHRFTLRGG